jgi:hypothetical protein
MSATLPRVVLLPSLLALLVGGCMAGPDYHGSQSAVSKAPAASGPFVSRHGSGVRAGTFARSLVDALRG